jgi:hypothetical protein
LGAIRWRADFPSPPLILFEGDVAPAYHECWDYYDRQLPLSHLSLAEGLTQAKFAVDTVIAHFQSCTMKSSLPTADWLVRAYLKYRPAGVF